MDLGISGKTGLVMASTRGLGFGCAAALAAEGVKVVINGRSLQRGATAKAELGENAHFIQADISHHEGRVRLYKEARAHLGPISILVTNADGLSAGKFLDKGIEDWRSAFELVMVSALEMVQWCLPEMVEQGFGRIINISSTSAKEIIPGPLFANGLKPSLIGAFGTLAREVAPNGVTVNSILPGPFDTERIRSYAVQIYGKGQMLPEEAMSVLADRQPMKRIGNIAEFGALCAFLCSHYAGYITGQSIVIDGGQVPALL